MLWLLLSLSVHASAKTVLLQGPGTSSFEYAAMLKSHPAMISPVDEYLATHPLPANRERLLAAFADAQREFLANSNDGAIPKFEVIVRMITLDDWERSDREIFLQAFLRLAQMETQPAKRDTWLGRSLVLGDAKIAGELYPPPLLHRRAELEQQLPKREVAKRLRVRGWNEVLLNGRSCGRNDCGALALYPGDVRVTLLSNQWVPVTETLDLADLDTPAFAGAAWASGDCRNSVPARASQEFADSKVFWGLDCEKAPALALSGLKPQPSPPTEPLPLFTSAAPQRKFYQSGWFWTGVGVAVVAVVVAASQKKSESKEASTAYGY